MPQGWADKLKTLRCDADLWEIAPDGQRTGEKLGGVELANAPDDKRIKWNWWYDKTAVNPTPPADPASLTPRACAMRYRVRIVIDAFPHSMRLRLMRLSAEWSASTTCDMPPLDTHLLYAPAQPCADVVCHVLKHGVGNRMGCNAGDTAIYEN